MVISAKDALNEVQNHKNDLLGAMFNQIVTHELVLRPWDDYPCSCGCGAIALGISTKFHDYDQFFNPLNLVLGENWFESVNDQDDNEAAVTVITYISDLWEMAFIAVNRPDIAAKLRDITENGL